MPEKPEEPYFTFEDGSHEDSLDSETRKMADAVEEMMRGFGVEGVTFADPKE